ncbi:MAG: [Clostridia bacterium]|nr:[FeFe] hydrogenase H-cluster maturation GTPase HydF [Clostridia bacterium]
MGLNEVSSGERLHIGFFGMRNAGKSSLVNAFTGQKLSVVSDVKGTTTDPVKKAMELLPLGPVLIIDTPGIDDEGALGEMRVEKAREILSKTDIAILVCDAQKGVTEADNSLIEIFNEKKIPYVIAFNKSDLLEKEEESKDNTVYVSALTGKNIDLLKNTVASLCKVKGEEKYIVSDLISEGDVVVLVTPIDESAPKGRLILPQQQTIRDILDKGAIAVTTQVFSLEKTLQSLKEKPRMVITDSQAFGKVSQLVPEDIPLTSFSILFARYKGELQSLIEGAKALETLSDGDRVLISEGCTHHRQCGDIGTVKMPLWIKNFSGKEIAFDFTSGGEFPQDLSEYKLVVHCGGCMLNEREMKSRQEKAQKDKIPMVNYGMAIAHMNGILKRSLEVFDK